MPRKKIAKGTFVEDRVDEMQAPKEEKKIREKKTKPSALAILQEENEKLRRELQKARPGRPKQTDGSVTFKSPWPGFRQVLKEALYRPLGQNHSVLVNPVVVEFHNQVCTLRPGDTFVDVDGRVVRKIDRMREIYEKMRAMRKRPHFVEVTDEVDLKVVDFRQRIPPAALVEFRGPLIDLPAIPPPPPPEAKETMDTLERKRPLYGR